MAKRIKRTIKKDTTKKVTKKAIKKEFDDSKIKDLAKALREECRERKCNCPFFDDKTYECKLTQEHLATPMNWEID